MPGKRAQRAFIGLMIGLMIAGILLAPLNTAIASNTGVQSVTNETVVAANETYVDLDGWQVQSGTVTVYYPNSSPTDYEVAVENTDYEIAYEPGQIKDLSGGNITDGDELLVTYDYAATDATATLIAGFIVTLVLVVMIWYPVNWIQEHY